MKRIRVLDLFAGTGGFHYGLKEALGSRLEVVMAVEIDKFAQQNYKHNHPGVPVRGDITTLDVSEVPDHDILAGGFPCQPFSMAGKRKGLDDTRGTLFHHIVRIAKAKRPSVMILENVKGLTTHHRGKTFRIIKETLEDAGYTVKSKVLNSRDYGSIQKRERIFLVCYLDSDKNFTFPEPAPDIYELRDILEEEPDPKHTLSDRGWKGKQKHRTKQWLKGNGFGYVLFHEGSTKWNTIKASQVDNNLLYQSYKNPRRLTPREIARLQGFPESFESVCSMTQTYKQLGNAVTVSVVKHLGRAVVKQLLDNKDSDRYSEQHNKSEINQESLIKNTIQIA